MRKSLIFFLTIGLFFTFSSCIKHEVIPAPVNAVDLNAYLNFFVKPTPNSQGTQVEFTQNVNGYKGIADKDVYIYASPVLSKVIYSSALVSPYSPQSLKISFGALDWDASANSDPTLTMFNDYHSSNSQIAIPFKDYNTLVNNSTDGIQVEYTDKNGTVWKSKESDPNQSATFTVLRQASDNTGDYSLFECTFSCKVWTYDVQLQQDISVEISNAVMRAWFKK
jgi:hypothetical protein